MKRLRAALWVEVRKALAAWVLWAGAALLIVGTGILSASLTAAVEAGNDQITAKLGQDADAAGWPLMTATVTQISMPMARTIASPSTLLRARAARPKPTIAALSPHACPGISARST